MKSEKTLNLEYYSNKGPLTVPTLQTQTGNCSKGYL